MPALVAIQDLDEAARREGHTIDLVHGLALHKVVTRRGDTKREITRQDVAIHHAVLIKVPLEHARGKLNMVRNPLLELRRNGAFSTHKIDRDLRSEVRFQMGPTTGL